MLNFIQKIYSILKVFLFSVLVFLVIGIIVLALINVGITSFSAKKIHQVENAPQASVAIVLGARVLPDKSLSDILRDRAETAIELWEEKKVEKILVSGDNGNKYYNEVVPVQKFMLEKGVPEDVIFLDYAGFDTYDSVYRAKNLFLVKDALIVTQEFHLPRAVYLCNKVGIECSGVIADKQPYLKAGYYARREFLARIKAFLDTFFCSSPEVMGETIDINAEKILD